LNVFVQAFSLDRCFTDDEQLFDRCFDKAGPAPSLHKSFPFLDACSDLQSKLI
jgi:hypothetical protein